MKIERSKKTNLMILSAIVALSIAFLMGNVPVVSGVGRYQLDSWGYADSVGTGMYGAFVIDTVTGTTQIVYRVEVTTNTQLVIENSLGKNFNSYGHKTPEDRRSIKESNKLYRMQKPG